MRKITINQPHELLEQDLVSVGCEVKAIMHKTGEDFTLRNRLCSYQRSPYPVSSKCHEPVPDVEDWQSELSTKITDGGRISEGVVDCAPYDLDAFRFVGDLAQSFLDRRWSDQYDLRLMRQQSWMRGYLAQIV